MTSEAQHRRARQADIFSRVNPGRASEMIVDQIRLLIRDGQLKPGDRLPAERELGEKFGVSRVTVREALRGLEANGMVTIKVGARGGAFVTAPTSARVGEGIIDLLSLSGLTDKEVTEARQVFELGIIPLVCERATEEDIDELLEIWTEGTPRSRMARILWSCRRSSTPGSPRRATTPRSRCSPNRSMAPHCDPWSCKEPILRWASGETGNIASSSSR